MDASHTGHAIADTNGRFLDFDRCYSGVLGPGRGELLIRVGRPADAALAYQAALALGMSAPERAFIERRLAAL